VSGALLQVVWSPGSDHLTGVCHCGAEYRADGPAEVWQWLLAHPDHEAGTGIPGREASTETFGHGESGETSEHEAGAEILGRESGTEARP
jgi:hypothetical protein